MTFKRSAASILGGGVATGVGAGIMIGGFIHLNQVDKVGDVWVTLGSLMFGMVVTGAGISVLVGTYPLAKKFFGGD